MKKRIAPFEKQQLVRRRLGSHMANSSKRLLGETKEVCVAKRHPGRPYRC
jgi:hypothetical protein